MDLNKIQNSNVAKDLEQTVRACEAMRKDGNNPIDITLADMVKEKHNLTMEAFYDEIGVDPQVDTIQNILDLPDTSVRWLIPEVFRDALRLGLRKVPIYPEIIAGEQNVKGLQFIQPSLQMSDAAMLYTGVAEQIRTGDINYTQKTVSLRKIARGIKIPYEVRNYCSLNFVSIFLQDLGVRMGQQADMLALSTMINGEQSDGSESAATIGINSTAGGLVYRDLTKPFIRMGRLGKQPSIMVAGEDMAITLLNLPEFKFRQASGPNYATLEVKSPMPNKSTVYVHSAIPANQVVIIDPSMALMKYNGQALMVESEKIVSNQTEATYASTILGFGIIFRDSRIIIDQSIAYSSNSFPSWMDPSTQEQISFSK